MLSISLNVVHGPLSLVPNRFYYCTQYCRHILLQAPQMSLRLKLHRTNFLQLSTLWCLHSDLRMQSTMIPQLIWRPYCIRPNKCALANSRGCALIREDAMWSVKMYLRYEKNAMISEALCRCTIYLLFFFRAIRFHDFNSLPPAFLSECTNIRLCVVLGSLTSLTVLSKVTLII